uniref:Putative chromatin accessibility complex protein 1 n=1 Tax=Tabanus bromius TaxID=304241 RepID=A0A0K8TT29_TABBR
MQRIKVIMKSTADNLPISSESLSVVTRATELFIQHLAKRAYETSDDSYLEYDHLAKLIGSEEKYEFLQQIIPKKLTAKECKELIMKNAAEDNLTSSEEDEEN